MSFRGISGLRPAINAVNTAINTAKGLPRCERLAGNATRADGGPVRTCPCVSVSSPHPSCPHKTEKHAKIFKLVTGSDWATPVDEADPIVMAALTAPQIALIRTIADAEIKAFARGEIDVD
jgi:hypothetical protein